MTKIFLLFKSSDANCLFIETGAFLTAIRSRQVVIRTPLVIKSNFVGVVYNQIVSRDVNGESVKLIIRINEVNHYKHIKQ